MMLITQIAIGTWLGGLCLAATFAAYLKIAERQDRARRYGHRTQPLTSPQDGGRS